MSFFRRLFDKFMRAFPPPAARNRAESRLAPAPVPEKAWMEFLIRRVDRGDWGPMALDHDVCHPETGSWRSLAGPGEEPKFEVAGTTFTCIGEMPGIQVIVKGGALDRAAASAVLEEVVKRIGAATGTPGYLVDLGSFGGRPIRF